MEKTKSFFKDGLSINEARVSILIISLIIVLVFSIFMYYENGVLGDNLTSIIKALITAVATVNIVGSAIDGFGKNSSNNDISSPNIDINIDGEDVDLEQFEEMIENSVTDLK